MRPGHFAGVGQVVARLLQLVEADYLLLGEKDYQQFMVVRDLLRQLRERKEPPSLENRPNTGGPSMEVPKERATRMGGLDQKGKNKVDPNNGGSNAGAVTRSAHRIPSLIMGPTHRDKGGLALSSRNQRLSPKGRLKARRIYAALRQARVGWCRETPAQLVQKIRSGLAEEPDFRVEYIQLADSDTLAEVVDWKNHTSVRIFAAVWIEGVRLIDNTVVFP